MASLLKRIGAYFRAPSDLKRISTPAGTMGVVVMEGWEETNEKNPKLNGQRKYTTYEELIRNVSIIGAALRNYLTMVASVDWKIEPSDESADAKEKAEIVDSVIHGMKKPWFRVVRSIAMFTYVGNSLHEWVAALRDDGVIVFEDICSRPSKTIERWFVDPGTAQLLGVVQRDPGDGTTRFIPRKKLIYLVDDTFTDSPQGEGLLRHVCVDVDRLRRYEQLEGYGFETDLRGVPLGRAPIAMLNKAVADGNMTAEDRDAALKVMTDFVSGHIRTPSLGLMLDSLTYTDQGDNITPSSNKQWDLELLKTSSNSLADNARAIERIITQIARVLNAQQLLMGGSSKGSFALGKEIYKAFAKSVDSTLTQLAASMRSDLLDPLWELNGWDPKVKPRLVPEALQLDDPTDIATALQLISQAGAVVMPGDPAVDAMRRLMHLPAVPEALVAAALQQHQERAPGTRGTTQASQQQNEPAENKGKVDAETSALSAKKGIVLKSFVKKGTWYQEVV